MKQSAPRIVGFRDEPAPEEYEFRPDPERVLDGNPVQSIRNHYESPGRHFSAGIWEGRPGIWRVDYAEEEFCHLLAGVVVITDEAGHARRFKAGDSFVVPAGFKGTWEVVEPARKLYAIYEDPKG